MVEGVCSGWLQHSQLLVGWLNVLPSPKEKLGKLRLCLSLPQLPGEKRDWDGELGLALLAHGMGSIMWDNPVFGTGELLRDNLVFGKG